MKNNSTPSPRRSFCSAFKIALFILVGFCGSTVKAQNAAQYIFTAFGGTYTDISGGTVVSAIHGDDSYTTGIPIGFNFNFCGGTYTTVAVSSNGWLSFGAPTNSYLGNDVSTLSSIVPCVMPLWDDLGGQAGVGSQASRITTGTAPNRVFTFEWKNWRWTYSVGGPVISFQVKLYETTGVVQCIYRQESTANSVNGATIGIARLNTDYQSLNNATAAPISSSTAFTTSITTRPASNQVYQWSPPVPCAGKPTAGSIVPISVCPNVNFNMSLTGTSVVSNLTYLWQKSPNNVTYTDITPSNSPTITQNINTPTWYRVIVTCNNGGQSDTTAPFLVLINSFYACYCNGSFATSPAADEDIGNVNIRTQPANVVLLNNGVGTPLNNNPTAVNGYTNFTNLPPAKLYRDSTYKFSVQQINLFSTMYNSRVAIYIDLNRDGIYQNPAELVVSQPTASPAYLATANYTIPSTADVGLTGMRVILQEGGTVPGPCTSYTWGETEDYIVELSFVPCDGAPGAGIAYSTDTLLCPGYPISLGDTTYEKMKAGLSHVWQVSINGGFGWTDIPGSTNKDTLNNIIVSTPLKFRLKRMCSFSGLSSTSNVISTTMLQTPACTGVSYAGGGITDSSDIGMFTIGDYMFNTGGPHLWNPLATKAWTKYVSPSNAVELYADSTYDLAVYHIMNPGNHCDARVTMFIDYNNNQMFDIPQERVWSSTSVENDWYRTGSITIPHQVVPDMPAAMRIVLNNNTGPNTASDNGVGVYTSGETEDYIVTLRRGWALGVGSSNTNLRSLAVYPNPSEGRFTVRLNAGNSIKHMDVAVMNMAGQQVTARSFDNVGNTIATDFDITGLAKGIYFVEVKADGEKMIRKLVVQ